MTGAAARRSGAPALSLPAWSHGPRFDIEARVVAQRGIIGNEFELVFHAPEIAQTARAGQFVEILFGQNYAPLVRRPFSLYRVDSSAGTCSILYLARGSFTSELAKKMVGDPLSVLGPLGRPFHWTPQTQSNRAGARTQHILIAGGFGAPPIYFLATELTRALRSEGASLHAASSHAGTEAQASAAPAHQHRAVQVDSPVPDAIDVPESRLVVINAARTESLLVGITEFGELDIRLHVMTDDGSRGVQGMATEMLEALLAGEPETPKALYACGPMPMLRSVGRIAIASGLPCQLSIETPMPCGIGLCQGCAVRVRDERAPESGSYALACVDGPVFEARDLEW